MYMNLKPNKHKRISFNTTTMISLGFIAHSPKIYVPPKLTFCSGPSPQLFWSNLNLISSGWNTKFFMQLKSTQYLPLPRFCQKLSCKLPSRTRPSIIKLGTNSI